MSISKVPVINKITHKELQLLYGLTKSGAAKRLAAIRRALGKKDTHVLTVTAFCQAEDITVQEFDFMLKRAYGISE